MTRDCKNCTSCTFLILLQKRFCKTLVSSCATKMSYSFISKVKQSFHTASDRYGCFEYLF